MIFEKQAQKRWLCEKCEIDSVGKGKKWREWKNEVSRQNGLDGDDTAAGEFGIGGESTVSKGGDADHTRQGVLDPADDDDQWWACGIDIKFLYCYSAENSL